MSGLGPVPPRERLVTLDVLRGVALCGVMVGNMVLYSGDWGRRGPAADPSVVDQIADVFLHIFVRSKAQTLLTLLFGFGFAVQLLRARERREPVTGVYVRRLVVLFGFGALHVVLLWWGDVMWTYAVAGFGLLLFLHASDRTRLLWALGFIFIPQLIVRSVPEVRLAAMGVFMDMAEFQAHTARMALVLRRPEHDGLAWEHLRYALVFTTGNYAWYYFWTLGRFLLGYIAGARRWFDGDGAQHLPVFRRFALWGGAIAVLTIAIDVMRMVGLLPNPPYGFWGHLASTTSHEVGLLAMTLACVGIIVLLMQRPAWRRLLRVFAPAGRMPLTTYCSQSLVCTFLFYGWGLGWAGSVGVAGCLGVALAVFGVQVAVAHLWLRHFRFGPLEWVWRSAVYLKLQPMRSAQASP
jgi:uncharacterized protein